MSGGGSIPAEATVDRLLSLVFAMRAGTVVTLEYIQRSHDVSLATAKRDMLKLQCLHTVVVRRVTGHQNAAGRSIAAICIRERA